ncbi:hypothetical protein HDU99_009990 [Rhizoclosmatium hyalinum]|nr:hypothetical protein HDU99_009990 [Rhizoclosmatium hyalinum]
MLSTFTARAEEFMIEEITRLRQDLNEKLVMLVKASNQVVSIRSKIITSLCDSAGLLNSKSEDVAKVLQFDLRDLEVVTNIACLQVETASATSVRYVDYLPSKRDIGEAVGLLYLELLSVDNDANNLPRYE